MSKPVKFARLAAREIKDAREYYRLIRRDLMVRFVTEVDDAPAEMIARPDSFPEYFRGTRRVLLKKFPYLVVFKDFGDRFFVVAIAHTSRKPGYWKSRLRKA